MKHSVNIISTLDPNMKAPDTALLHQNQESENLIEIDDLDLASDKELAEIKTVSVLIEQHGQRLDAVLTQLLQAFSRNYLRQQIDLGLVKVNNKTVIKPAAKVNANDVLEIELRATPQSQAFKPEAMAIDVLYQDADIWVVNKPAGLVVHPAPGNWSGTLLNGLLHLDPNLVLLPRAGIVHRLDKDTSGLMVVARTRAAMDNLVTKIAARDVHREYLALAHHPWLGQPTRVVNAAIGRDPIHRLRMAAVDLTRHSGKEAKTTFYVVTTAEEACLVHCVLHTGRTHQIRVHLSSIGHSIVGDGVYGRTAEGPIKRQALHATRLSFDHPITGKSLSFMCPIPEDFEMALAWYGLSYNGELEQRPFDSATI